MSKGEEKLLAQRVVHLENQLKEKDEALVENNKKLIELSHRLSQLSERVSKHVDMANKIHTLLVPTRIPSFPDFEFSSKYIASPIAGGDYFDLFELEDKFRFGLLVASSSGYGMSANFLSVLLKFLAQRDTRSIGDPFSFISKIYGQLVETIGSDDSINIFFSIIDRKTFEMSYVNYGPLYVWLYKSNAERPLKLGSHGPGLSVDNPPEDGRKSLVMDPKDRLLICTPGVIDRQNRSGERFSTEKVEKLLMDNRKSGCHELRNELFFQMESFSEGLDAERDLTVIVSDVKDRVLRLADS